MWVVDVVDGKQMLMAIPRGALLCLHKRHRCAITREDWRLTGAREAQVFNLSWLWGHVLAYAERYRILGIAIVAPPPKFTIEFRHS